MLPPDSAIHTHTASIDIAASPQEVYGMVSDITRMGEWSPEATGGSWTDGGTGAVGDWFVGDNQAGEREWSRDCQVAAADPGKDFTFVVGGVEANCTWWSYEMDEIEDGTRLTERWWMVNKTPAMAAAAPEVYDARIINTEFGMQQTLAAIKAAAES